MQSLTAFFDREEKEILRRMEGFQRILTRLRYEGKPSRGQNIKAARKAVEELVRLLSKHRRLQEGVIFPFLQVHIPKHDPAIRFLRADHAAIRKSKLRIRALLRKLTGSAKRGTEDGRLHEIGLYLLCLMRHHLELEKQNIHRAIRKELRPGEKKDVEGRIRRWLRKS